LPTVPWNAIEFGFFRDGGPTMTLTFCEPSVPSTSKVTVVRWRSAAVFRHR